MLGFPSVMQPCIFTTILFLSQNIGVTKDTVSPSQTLGGHLLPAPLKLAPGHGLIGYCDEII